MIRSIIIDDEATARVLIEQYCLQNNIEIVKHFNTAIDALKWINENNVDLIFLDLHMPKFSGIDFIKSIKNPSNIVITTSDPNFAVEAFNFPFIVGYLIKPVTQTQFKKIVERINLIYDTKEVPDLEPKPNNIFVNIDKRLVRILIDDINIIQAQGDNVLIKTTNTNYRVNTTLKRINAKLPATIFFQLHRSYIINLSKIIDIEMNSVLIEKDVIPIGRSKKEELINKLNLL